MAQTEDSALTPSLSIFNLRKPAATPYSSLAPKFTALPCIVGAGFALF